MPVRNLAKEHFERTVAARDRGDATTDQGSAHDLLLRSLAIDKGKLKSIRSIEEKINYKRGALEKYVPWVQGAMAGDRGAQDPVVVHMLAWLLDVGAFQPGLDVGGYVLRHGLVMPDDYHRNAATVIGDMIADAALKELDQGNPADLPALLRAMELTTGHDMPDQVRAKLHKAAGLALLPKSLPDEGDERGEQAVLGADNHLRRAFQLWQQAGVKKPMERAQRFVADLQKRAKKAEPAAPQGNPNTQKSVGETGSDKGAEGAGDGTAGASTGGEGSPPAGAPGPAP